VYRPGKRNIYLRDDLLRYVKTRRVLPSADIEDFAGSLEEALLESASDDVRERSRRRAS
jgi:hypothetical protein